MIHRAQLAPPAAVVSIAIVLKLVCRAIGLGDLETLVTANTAFGLACVVILVRPARIRLGPSPVGFGLRAATWYCGLLLLVGHGIPGRRGIPEAAVVLYAAAIEEVVFRSWLPAAIARRAAGDARTHRTLIIHAQCIAQVAFALAHTLTRPVDTAHAFLAETGRLTAIGIAWSGIVATTSLSFASAAHGMLNLQVADSGGRLALHPDAASIAMVAFAGLTVLAIDSKRFLKRTSPQPREAEIE